MAALERWKTSFFLDWFLVVCVFSIFAGSVTPEVNESHYWVKAKHFWDSEFASRDMFVQSKDAHWFFFVSLGWLTKYTSLSIAVWIGRILSWGAVAFGWCYFVRQFSSIWMIGTLSTPLWIAAMQWGHLSGEWVVGGCEAKVFAYAAAFIGLACVVKEAWGWGWIWIGVAAAFHVLTGAWLALACLVFCVADWMRVKIESRHTPTFQQRSFDWIGLLVGGGLSLLGLLPAIFLNQGSSLAIQEQGAMIYVFQRLPHHLVPTQFGTVRWCSFAVLLAVTIASVVWLRRHRELREQVPASGNKNDLAILLARHRSLVAVAFITFVFTAIGLLIDLTLSPWATNWSASLLRYYWFRWNDVLCPMTLVTTFILILDKRLDLSKCYRIAACVVLILPGTIAIGIRYQAHNRESISPADKATLLLRSESPTMQNQVLRDWLDMCAYIQANTDKQGLFLTPRFQQTFKWYAGRAEVACWKDAPQDAIGLIEWEKRLLKIFPYGPDGFGLPWSDSLLNELGQEYQIDYVLIDRRVQTAPPILEYIQSNKTFALFRFPDMGFPSQPSWKKLP